MDPDSVSRAEHPLISSSLEVEELDRNLFRSVSLYVPTRARGVFGGQVVSQALVSATNCVDPAFVLHSLHGYFLLSGAASQPILYYVERLRDGNSYSTRSVKAVQQGRLIFTLIASYQRPEPTQPLHQLAQPPVPSPDDCELMGDYYKRMANDPNVSERNRTLWANRAAEDASSPLAFKIAFEKRTSNGMTMLGYWVRAKGIPRYNAPFQKCILSYISDNMLLGAAIRELGLSWGNSGPKRLGMSASLDHSMWFYDSNFHCGDWLLWMVWSPVAGSGRGFTEGRFYQNGTLIAVVAQEGLVRAAESGSPQPTLEKTKL